jgi:PPIC-type PPIASE domain
MTNSPERGRWLREPLLHFLVIGTGLFLLYHFVRGGNETAPREIVISEPRIEALAENFGRTWMRPPTPQEMRGLVDDYVKEEVFYREAIAMGLDRDDTVIRRRLRQKMEFVSEDAAATAEPTEAQLQQFLTQHPEKFVKPARVTFEQVFVNAEQRGAAARRDAEQILAGLQSGRASATPADAGDATLLPAALEDASPQQIAGSFGDEFGKQLDAAPIGQWSGPIVSTFGLHLVRVTARSAGVLPKLADIRPLVVREWQAQQRTQAADSFYSSLRTKYAVRYEGEIGQLLQQAPGTAATK